MKKTKKIKIRLLNEVGFGKEYAQSLDKNKFSVQECINAANGTFPTGMVLEVEEKKAMALIRSHSAEPHRRGLKKELAQDLEKEKLHNAPSIPEKNHLDAER